MLMLAGLLGVVGVGAVALGLGGLSTSGEVAEDVDMMDDGADLVAESDAPIMPLPVPDEEITGEGEATMAGTEGEDELIIPSESDTYAPIDVMEFDSTEDSIVVIWDHDDNPDPAIELVPDSDDPDLTRVMVDDTEVAQLVGAQDLSTDDIVLMSSEEVEALGLAA